MKFKRKLATVLLVTTLFTSTGCTALFHQRNMSDEELKEMGNINESLLEKKEETKKSFKDAKYAAETAAEVIYNQKFDKVEKVLNMKKDEFKDYVQARVIKKQGNILSGYSELYFDGMTHSIFDILIDYSEAYLNIMGSVTDWKVKNVEVVEDGAEVTYKLRPVDLNTLTNQSIENLSERIGGRKEVERIGLDRGIPKELSGEVQHIASLYQIGQDYLYSKDSPKLYKEIEFTVFFDIDRNGNYYLSEESLLEIANHAIYVMNDEEQDESDAAKK